MQKHAKHTTWHQALPGNAVFQVSDLADP